MEGAAITVTMLSAIALTLSLLSVLILLVSLLFFLNKYDQEKGLLGGDLWKKVYRRSQSFANSLEDEKEKRSVLLRLKGVRISLKVMLVSLAGIAISIVLWQFVP